MAFGIKTTSNPEIGDIIIATKNIETFRVGEAGKTVSGMICIGKEIGIIVGIEHSLIDQWYYWIINTHDMDVSGKIASKLIAIKQDSSSLKYEVNPFFDYKGIRDPNQAKFPKTSTQTQATDKKPYFILGLPIWAFMAVLGFVTFILILAVLYFKETPEQVDLQALQQIQEPKAAVASENNVVSKMIMPTLNIRIKPSQHLPTTLNQL